MKRIVFYVMTALMSANTFANGTGNFGVIREAAMSQGQEQGGNYNISFDAQHVNTILGITEDSKAEQVESFCNRFAQDMESVQKSREKARPGRMVSAVYRNLIHMTDILTREEYHHYLLYVNQVLSENDLAQYFK